MTITIRAHSSAALTAYLAEKRWNVETGSITVNGLPVPTDDRAKLLLLGASTSMADEDTAPFVTSAGAVSLTGAQFKALYAAITAHVQACFAVQQSALAAIGNGSITTPAQIDALAWPG